MQEREKKPKSGTIMALNSIKTSISVRLIDLSRILAEIGTNISRWMIDGIPERLLVLNRWQTVDTKQQMQDS